MTSLILAYTLAALAVAGYVARLTMIARRRAALRNKHPLGTLVVAFAATSLVVDATNAADGNAPAVDVAATAAATTTAPDATAAEAAAKANDARLETPPALPLDADEASHFVPAPLEVDDRPAMDSEERPSDPWREAASNESTAAPVDKTSTDDARYWRATARFGEPDSLPHYDSEAVADGRHGRFGGLVVDGTHGDQPLAGADVVLRATDGANYATQFEMKTDELGQFEFTRLPVARGLIYSAGVNRDGVHYPGPAVELSDAEPSRRVRLRAFEAVESPSPLVALVHEISVRRIDRTLEVIESIVVQNPTLRGYVGVAAEEGAPVTLTITPIPGFATITFASESLGRSFHAHDGRLTTDLPWAPGAREITFKYRLPIHQRSLTLTRAFDLPCSNFLLRVEGELQQNAELDVAGERLTIDEKASDAAIWKIMGRRLAAGEPIELRLDGLPVSAWSYAKWVAVGVLSLLAGTIFVRRARRRAGSTQTSKTGKGEGSAQAAERNKNVPPRLTVYTGSDDSAVTSSPTSRTPAASPNGKRSSSRGRSPSRSSGSRPRQAG